MKAREIIGAANGLQQEEKGDTEVNSSLSINFRAGWIKPI